MEKSLNQKIFDLSTLKDDGGDSDCKMILLIDNKGEFKSIENCDVMKQPLKIIKSELHNKN